MAAMDSTSKKRSGANSSLTSKQPDRTFFLDRGLGRHYVADALRAAGCSVELHDDHFSQDTVDDVWLEEVGKRNWVILTKDRNMGSNQIELSKLLKANVPCFNLASAEMKGPEMADAFVKALPHMKRMIEKYHPPFIANVSRRGEIRILHTAADVMKRIR